MIPVLISCAITIFLMILASILLKWDDRHFYLALSLVVIVYFVLALIIIDEQNDITDTYINGIHYKEINGTTVNITKDSLEMQIYKDYQKRFK